MNAQMTWPTLEHLSALAFLFSSFLFFFCVNFLLFFFVFNRASHCKKRARCLSSSCCSSSGRDYVDVECVADSSVVDVVVAAAAADRCWQRRPQQQHISI